MTILASLAIIALVAVVYLLLRSHRQAEADWTIERRELLTRIQAPERIPITTPAIFEIPEPEVDERELVGTVTYDEPEGG